MEGREGLSRDLVPCVVPVHLLRLHVKLEVSDQLLLLVELPFELADLVVFKLQLHLDKVSLLQVFSPCKRNLIHLINYYSI